MGLFVLLAMNYKYVIPPPTEDEDLDLTPEEFDERTGQHPRLSHGDIPLSHRPRKGSKSSTGQENRAYE